MKIYFDRRHCHLCQYYCDRHVAKLIRFPLGEDRPCIQALNDDGQPQLTLVVKAGEHEATLSLTEHIAGDGADPLIEPHFAATGAEAGLAGKGNTEVIPTLGAFVEGATGFRVTVQHHVLCGRSHVGALVSGDFVVKSQVTPTIKMIAENLAKEIGTGRAIRAKREGDDNRRAK